jgi:hypothetical protein
MVTYHYVHLRQDDDSETRYIVEVEHTPALGGIDLTIQACQAIASVRLDENGVEVFDYLHEDMLLDTQPGGEDEERILVACGLR